MPPAGKLPLTPTGPLVQCAHKQAQSPTHTYLPQDPLTARPTYTTIELDTMTQDWGDLPALIPWGSLTALIFIPTALTTQLTG